MQGSGSGSGLGSGGSRGDLLAGFASSGSFSSHDTAERPSSTIEDQGGASNIMDESDSDVDVDDNYAGTATNDDSLLSGISNVMNLPGFDISRSDSVSSYRLQPPPPPAPPTGVQLLDDSNFSGFGGESSTSPELALEGFQSSAVYIFCGVFCLRVCAR